MKDGKLLVNEIPSLGILTIYAFCCTGRTNWLQKVTTPCLFPDEFSSLPFCFFDHSLLLFIIHIWFICIVALSNKGPIACTQLIQLAVMNLSSVTTPHGSPYTEAHWPEKQTVRLFVDLVTGVSQSGERRRRRVRRWFSLRWYCQQRPPRPQRLPTIVSKKERRERKSEEARKEIVSISLSTSKNLLQLSALIRNHGILSFLATLTKQDHLRMNDSTRSNNHLWSIDLFRSMII